MRRLAVVIVVLAIAGILLALLFSKSSPNPQKQSQTTQTQPKLYNLSGQITKITQNGPQTILTLNKKYDIVIDTNTKVYTLQNNQTTASYLTVGTGIIASTIWGPQIVAQRIHVFALPLTPTP